MCLFLYTHELDDPLQKEIYPPFFIRGSAGSLTTVWRSAFAVFFSIFFYGEARALERRLEGHIFFAFMILGTDRIKRGRKEKGRKRRRSDKNDFMLGFPSQHLSITSMQWYSTQSAFFAFTEQVVSNVN